MEEMIDPQLPSISQEIEIDWDQTRRQLRDRISRKLQGFSRTDLEDATQEALVRMLRACRSEEIRSPAALATSIADRTAVDWIRRRKVTRVREREMTDQDLNRPGPRIEEDTVPGDPVERIRFLVLEFFHQHNQGCWELARVYFGGNQDWKMVSQAQGIGHDTVRARWSRCVAQLRKHASQHPEFVLLYDWAVS
jgi:RNA polymerase sigma factor (sigma-70 family)